MATDAEQLLETVSQALAEVPDFPMRMDQMSHNEFEIAKVACSLTGTLLYVERKLKAIVEKEKTNAQ